MSVKPGVVCAWLLAAAVVRFWLMPLGSSFWVDEMGTVFVVQMGAHHPSLAVAPQVPDSIYYWLPRVSHALFGASEIAYRIPSTLVMVVALFVLARLAARLVRPEAAWLAVFAALALRGFNYQADDARPYALGTLAASAAVLFLVRWLDRGRWIDAVAFIVCASLLWRVQLVFWPFYIVLAIYPLSRLTARDTPVTWVQAAVVYAALAVSLVPVLIDGLALYRHAQDHVVARLPHRREVVDVLKPGLILVCAAGAWVASRVFRWRAEPAVISRPSFLLMMAWWLAQPVGLFLFSWVTAKSVFLPRYLWLALPGAALLAAVAAARFVPPKRLAWAAAALGAGTLVFNGEWTHLFPLHHNSDWRSAAQTVRSELQGAGTPVICPSPFIEARPPAWSPQYPLPGFLYAHLYVYPIGGAKYLFPFEFSPAAERYASEFLRAIVPSQQRFLIYAGQGQARFWREWFESRPELRNWRVTTRLFADIAVVLFERPPDLAGVGDRAAADPLSRVPPMQVFPDVRPEFR